MKRVAILVALALQTTVVAANGDATSKTAVVAAGTYRPLFPVNGETEIPVAAFKMDRTPVTNAEFLAFVTAHPEWRRDRVPAVMAEPTYLSHWSSADALGSAAPNQPVVNVSWFAARAYCGARGMRLPTEAEWERAANDPTERDEVPGTLTDVARSRANQWGLYDMHALVWEWVSDFGNAILALGGSDALRFCGATGASATDATNFAAFQRVAFRSSLHASYAIKSLGFRCAVSS